MGVEINNDKALNFFKAYDLSVDRGMERFQKFWLQFDFIYSYTNLQKEKESCLNIVRALPEFVRILFLLMNENYSKLQYFLRLIFLLCPRLQKTIG